jgi:hypothetical protein
MARETDGVEAVKAAGIQAVKAARNHSLLFEATERIRVMTETSGTAEFFCECATGDCTATIRVSLAEYERIRSSPPSFMIALRHDLPEFEDVIEVCDHYEVVLQKGARRIGTNFNPSSP